MAITDFQRRICKLMAANRITQGESYIDTDQAVMSAWDSDKRLLEQHGYIVDVLRFLPSFVEALVRKGVDTVAMQWARDSAFRFFPLLEDPTFGLTLHPFDLATNKVLAMAGRLEVRDWIDVIACHERI